jgi:hypothetical protein
MEATNEQPILVSSMKRLLLTCALVLLAAPAALAATAAPAEGTLSVRNGDGNVTLTLRGGAIIGRFASGTISVEVPDSGDCDEPLVFGAEREVVKTDELGFVTRCVYSGRNLRFRLVGAEQLVRITNAKDADLSVVGRGSVILKAAAPFRSGTYSLNGGDYVPLPDVAKRIVLGTPLAGGGNAVQ